MDCSKNQVSVIIPVYNGAAYLMEAIESVRRQRRALLEIVVVDDGSTDESARLAESSSDVKLIRKNRQGVAAARNAGIEAASGEYLAFLDADDLWPEGKLLAQLQAFEQDSSVHIVAGRVEEFGEGDLASVRTKRQSGDRAYTIGAMLIPREDFLRVGFLDPSLRFGEFIDWHSRAIATGLKERILDQVVLQRRLHSANTTRHAGAAEHDYLAAIRRHLERKRGVATASATPTEQDQKS